MLWVVTFNNWKRTDDHWWEERKGTASNVDSDILEDQVRIRMIGDWLAHQTTDIKWLEQRESVRQNRKPGKAFEEEFNVSLWLFHWSRATGLWCCRETEAQFCIFAGITCTCWDQTCADRNKRHDSKVHRVSIISVLERRTTLYAADLELSQFAFLKRSLSRSGVIPQNPGSEKVTFGCGFTAEAKFMTLQIWYFQIWFHRKKQ